MFAQKSIICFLLEDENLIAKNKSLFEIFFHQWYITQVMQKINYT